jgi:hypothetical protein
MHTSTDTNPPKNYNNKFIEKTNNSICPKEIQISQQINGLTLSRSNGAVCLSWKEPSSAH